MNVGRAFLYRWRDVNVFAVDPGRVSLPESTSAPPSHDRGDHVSTDAVTPVPFAGLRTGCCGCCRIDAAVWWTARFPVRGRDTLSASVCSASSAGLRYVDRPGGYESRPSPTPMAGAQRTTIVRPRIRRPYRDPVPASAPPIKNVRRVPSIRGTELSTGWKTHALQRDLGAKSSTGWKMHALPRDRGANPQHRLENAHVGPRSACGRRHRSSNEHDHPRRQRRTLQKCEVGERRGGAALSLNLKPFDKLRACAATQ